MSTKKVRSTRGKPVAKLVPLEPSQPPEIFGCMKATVLESRDLVLPTGEHWDAEAGEISQQITSALSPAQSP